MKRIILALSLAWPAFATFPDICVKCWYEVPNSVLDSVFQSPRPPGWGSVNAIMDENGGVYDTRRNRLIVTGGGGSGYMGNEVYAFSLDSLKWERIKDAATYFDDSDSISAYYFNGGAVPDSQQPRPAYNFDQIEYDSTTDNLFLFGQSFASWNGTTWPNVLQLNLGTLTWSQPATINSELHGGNVSARHPGTGKIWFYGNGTYGWLSEFDPSTGTVTDHGDIWNSGDWINSNQNAAIMPPKDRMISIGAGQALYWDVATSGYSPPHELPVTGCDSLMAVDAPGFEWSPVDNKMVGWARGGRVVTMDTTYTCTVEEPSDSNTVTPEDPMPYGTFGRWRYVPKYNVFVVVSSETGHVYLYRHSAGSGTTPPSPPVVVITSPSRDTTVRPDSILVRFTVDAVLDSQKVGLVPGPNQVIISRTNTGGTGKDTVNIYRDTIPPVIVITHPPADTLYTTNSAAVAWTVDGVTQTSQTTESLTADGAHLIIRTAMDSAGNVGADTVRVFRDMTPPAVVITSPADGHSVVDQAYTYITWTVDGVNQTTQLFESLPIEGLNVIIRSATDSAGNVGADTIYVFRDMFGPVVSLDYPRQSAVILDTAVDIHWKVDGVSQTPIHHFMDSSEANTILLTAADTVGHTDTLRVQYYSGVLVPDLIGKTYHQADSILAVKRLAKDSAWVDNDTVPTGQVFEQKPLVGDSLPFHHKVHYKLSRGLDAKDLTPVLLETKDMTVNPLSLEAGGFVRIEVANRGRTAVTDSFRIILFEDIDKNLEFSPGVDLVLGSVSSEDPLSAGDTAEFDVAVKGNLTFNGNRITVWVDSGNAIPETDEANNLMHSMAQCRKLPLTVDYTPRQKWRWKDTLTHEVPLSTPLVAHLTDDNGDGKYDGKDNPEVLVATSNNLFALDGRTGREIWKKNAKPWFYATYAIGDIDGDGKPEIAIIDISSFFWERRILIFDNLGNRKDSSDYFFFGSSGFGLMEGLTLADLDGDGKSEILWGQNIFDHHGKFISPHSFDYVFHRTLAADLDQDGFQETIGPMQLPTESAPMLSIFSFRDKAFNNRVLSWLNEVPHIVKLGGIPRILSSNIGAYYGPSGGFRVYNFNLDSLRIILGTRFPDSLPGSFSTDIYSEYPFFGKDSSQLLFDLGAVARTAHGIYSEWSYFTRLDFNDSSIAFRDFPTSRSAVSVARGSVFDFADDDNPKVIIRIADSLLIIDSSTHTLGRVSGIPGNTTGYPCGVIVADADNDGHADIITATGQDSGGIVLFSNPTWVGARSIYNQKDYTVTNIDDDGRIPRFPYPAWEANNTNQIQCTEGHYACVDVTASLPQLVMYDSVADTLAARIGNGGALPLAAGIPISLYAQGGGREHLLAVRKTPNRLEAGEFYTFHYGLPDSLKGPYSFRFAADDSGNGHGGLDESDEINNSVVLSAMVNNHAPIVANPGIRYAPSGTLFQDTISATDADGDSVLFRLAQAPLGMSLDSRTGILSWTPSDTLTHFAVRIAATDIHQATTMATLMVYVTTSSNHAPHIASFPDTNAYLNAEGLPTTQVFRYAIQAIDSDGEALDYSFSCLSCDSLTGPLPDLISNQLRWIPFTPLWANGDSLRLRVTVTDPRGSMDSQTFTLRIVDPAAAGNHPPAFLTSPPTSVVAGADYAYQAKATDADGDLIAYSLPTHPTGMTQSAGLVQWHTPPTPGATANVQMTVTDIHSAASSQSWQITLLPDVTPPAVSLQFSQNPVQPGTSVTVTVNARDNVGVGAKFLSLNGSSVTLTGDHYTFTPSAGGYAFEATAEDTSGNIGHGTGILRVTSSADHTPPTVSLSHSPSSPSAGDVITFTVTATDNVAVDADRLWVRFDGANLPVVSGSATYRALRPGSFTAKVAAFDASGNSAMATDGVAVSALSGDATAPIAILNSPVEDSVVYSRVDVVGTASDAHLAYYTLSYRDVNTNDWIEFHRSEAAVISDKLGTIDATTLVNGDYAIRLAVYDGAGNATFDTTQVTVLGEKKVGNFTLSFQDLNVPMSGLDLSVTRTYDSRVKTKGDFGIGWKMGMRSLSLSENRNQGTEWSVETHFGFIPTFELDGVKAHTVTVTLSGGRKQEFDAVPRFISPFVPAVGTMTYVPRPGTYGKLEATDASSFLVIGGELYDANGTLEEPFNPQVYKLTLLDGSYFVFDQDEGGVIESGDANGNKVTWDSAFVAHQSGSEIDFTRDDEGRITGITDDAGRSYQYVYDVLGNLDQVIDPNGNVTQFKYGPNSYLTDIVDARGVRANRTEYDDEGRIVRQINAAGDTLNMHHDLDHNFEEVMDYNGHVTSYNYDLHGNVVRKEDDAGNKWFYAYDSSDNLLTTLQPNGTLKTSTYDDFGNELSSTDELGHTTFRTYNASGKPLTVTDPLDRTTTYVYDAAGNMVQETGTDGTVQSKRTYDARGDVLSEKDALGYLTFHTYNSSGWLTSTTDAEGHVRHFGYDGAGNMAYEVDALGDTTRYGYDNNGNRVLEVGPTQDSVKSVYNAINKPVRRTDALGHVALSVYDNLGDKVADTAADTTVTSRTYDGQGNVKTVTDAAGRTTTMDYDFANRLIKTTFADGHYASMVYDAQGRRIKSIDARGNETTYDYDNAGRNTSVTDALGHTTYFEYDAAGRKTAMVDALGHRTDYEYDDYDRLVKTTFANGSATQVGYDAAGRKTSETDQSGFTTHFAYDSVGNLRAVIDAYGDSTRYTYDGNNNRLTQKDANGHTTSMAYDVLNRMISRTYPNGDQERWTYDANGAMLSHVKGTDSTDYAYDVMEREVSRHHYNSGHTVATTYTPDGKRETVTDYRGTTVFSYDNRGRLAGEGYPNGDSLENHYDAQGNRTSVVTPFGTTTYTYDVLNRMASVVSPQSKITTYHYDAVGNRDSVVNPNGTTSGYQYDNLNRLTRVRHYKAGTILAHYAYTLNAAGIRTQVTEKDSSKAFYGYDSLYRLKSERRTGSHTDTMTYTYDPVGNRLTKGHRGVTTNYAYNNRDQLLSEWDGTDSTRYSYDSAGRMLTKADAGGTTNYRWRDEDRLDSLYGPGVSVKYQYDAEGRRVKDSRGSTVRQYLVDPLLPYGQVIAETDGSNSLVAEYVYGQERVSLRRSGAAHYYLADGQGSTRLLTDSTGTATDSTVYTAFGETLFSSGSTPNDFKYVGEQFDGNSELYYNRARWLDVKTGRFASVDPYTGKVGKPISLQRYLYADQSAVSRTDPSGMMTLLEVSSPGTQSLQASYRVMSQAAATNYWGWFTRHLVVGAISTAYLADIGWDAAKQREWLAQARNENPLRLRHYTTEKGKVKISESDLIKNPNNDGNYFTSDLYTESEVAADKLATWNEPDFYIELNMYKAADQLSDPYPVSSEVYIKDGVVKIRLGGGRQYRTDLPIPIGGVMRMSQWIPLTE